MSDHFERRPAIGPWGICIILLVATFLNYMDRQVLAVTLPTLKSEYQLREGQVGKIEGAFGFAFAAGSLFFGAIADRVGPRILYPAVLAGWSLAGIATSQAGAPWVSQWLGTQGDPASTVYSWLLVCRSILGFCEAGHWPCALITIRAILSQRDRTLGNGILQSGASLGAIVVPIYVEACEQAGQPWPFPFWSIGLVGLAWIPLWFLFTRSHDLRVHRTVELASVERALEPRRLLIRRLVVLAVVVATLTISWQFLRAWLALFLQDHLGYSKQAARGLMSGYFIAADIGCLLSGALVSTLVRMGWNLLSARHLGYFIFTLLTACGAIVPYAGSGVAMVILLFVTGAGILGLHPFYYAMNQDLPAARMGTFVGALAAFGWIVSSISQVYLGQQIEQSKSYSLGLAIVGLAPMFGLVAILLLWPPNRSPSISS